MCRCGFSWQASFPSLMFLHSAACSLQIPAMVFALVLLLAGAAGLPALLAQQASYTPPADGSVPKIVHHMHGNISMLR